jgi:hypothetical protein
MGVHLPSYSQQMKAGENLVKSTLWAPATQRVLAPQPEFHGIFGTAVGTLLYRFASGMRLEHFP